MNAKSVLKYASEQGAKFVSTRFTDLPGSWQHLTFPISELDEGSFEDGFGFDASSIRGWAAIHESDMLLIPDSYRAWMDPFAKEPTLCVICNAVDPISRQGYAFDPRNVAKTWHAILRKTRIADTAVFKLDGFKQCATQSHDICADDLVAQAVRIDDGAAFERGDDAHHADVARVLLDGDFRAGCHVAIFFHTTADPESLSRLRFLSRPARRFCGAFKNGAQSRIGKILHAKFQRIDLRGAGQFVHEGFARKVICGCREPAI